MVDFPRNAKPWLLFLGAVLLGAGFALVIFVGFPGAEAQTMPSAATSASSEMQSSAIVGVGEEAPEFELFDLEGEPVRLSDHRDHVVLVNFWATWCGPCRIEMPAIQERYERYRDAGLTVLAVDFDESAEAVRAFGDELGLTFPLLLDPGGVIQRRYRILGYPTSVFIDGGGVIRAVHIGLMNEKQLDGYLADLGF